MIFRVRCGRRFRSPRALRFIKSLQAIDNLFRELAGTVLGIISSDPGAVQASDVKLEANLVQLLIDVRGEVRTQKLWSLSDKIRDGLKKLGITLEDKKDGTGWRRE